MSGHKPNYLETFLLSRSHLKPPEIFMDILLPEHKINLLKKKRMDGLLRTLQTLIFPTFLQSLPILLHNFQDPKSSNVLRLAPVQVLFTYFVFSHYEVVESLRLLTLTILRSQEILHRVEFQAWFDRVHLAERNDTASSHISRPDVQGYMMMQQMQVRSFLLHFLVLLRFTTTFYILLKYPSLL